MRRLLRERQQRIAFRAAHAAPSVFAEEENDERENQAETDRESEWDDGHDAAAVGRGFEF